MHVVALAEHFVEGGLPRVPRGSARGTASGIDEHVGRQLRHGRAGRDRGAGAEARCGEACGCARAAAGQSEEGDVSRSVRARDAAATSSFTQRATRYAVEPGCAASFALRPSALRRVGRPATRPAMVCRQVVYGHGVTHAAVVARDDFEILEADAVGGPILRFGGHQQRGRAPGCSPVSKSTPLALRPATVSLSARLPGSAVTGASGCSTASASTGPSATQPCSLK